jgi:hypothetical protein
MELQALIAKLEQIQQHAQVVLNEYPRALTEERLRLIIALARQLRAEMEVKGSVHPIVAIDGRGRC